MKAGLPFAFGLPGEGLGLGDRNRDESFQTASEAQSRVIPRSWGCLPILMKETAGER